VLRKYLNNSIFYTILAALTIFADIFWLYCLASYKKEITFWGFELKKIDAGIDAGIEVADMQFNPQELDSVQFQDSKKTEHSVVNSSQDLIATTAKNSGGLLTTENNKAIVKQNMHFSDTVSTGQRVLLMGDSESEGLSYEIADYCAENGHKYVGTVIWYSASIYNFAYADTVNKIIESLKPTYIFFVVGLNEMYARDLAKRRTAARIFAQKISNFPYTWIGPANYMEDKGINGVFKEAAAPNSFFLTKGMTLTRGVDKRHPDKQGYRVWMDSIANWIHTTGQHKITMNQPRERNRKNKRNNFIFNASNYRGY